MAAAPPRPRRLAWPSRMQPSRMSVMAALLSAAFMVALLVVWQVLVMAHAISPLILPPPAGVWVAFVDGVFYGTWWPDIAVTIEETVIGLLAGSISAIAIGALFSFVEVLRRAAYPYLLAVQAFPKVALAPLLMAWLGYGLGPKVIISAMLAFFPVFTNTLAGFMEVDISSVELLRSMRATRLQELRYLRLPHALAFIVPSLDVALVLALLGAIAAELAGAQAGLGQVIAERTFQGDGAAVYAVLILLASIGIGLRWIAKFCVGLVHRPH
jgi:NitT/TauT family transport system permease protein